MANNPVLYNAAIAGLAGGVEQRWITQIQLTDYVLLRNLVIAVATQVDAAIPTDLTVSISDCELLSSICRGVINERFPTSLNSATYTDISSAIAALYQTVRAGMLPVPLNPFLTKGTIAGQIIYWDNAVSDWVITPTGPTNTQNPTWNAATNTYDFTVTGISGLSYFGLDNNPVGLWNFNETLADVSGNGNDLTLAAGTLSFCDIVPGVKALYGVNGARYATAAAVALLQIVGDITILCIMQPDNDPTTAPVVLATYAGSAETQVENTLYQMNVAQVSGATPIIPRQLNWFSESGAGVDANFLTAGSPSMPPVHNVCFIAARRQANVVQMFYNGKPFAAPSGVLATPDGGTSANNRFMVGAATPAGSVSNNFVIMSLKVCATSLTNAQILAEYNRTMGPAYGRLT